jgi:tetratricopeptide (TPR) repeat protein
VIRRAHLIALAWACLAAAPAAGADPRDAWREGNAAYASGRFDDARASYRRAEAGGGRFAALYHNLGAAEAELGNAGPAALAFERALLADPGAAASRAALESLRRATGARVAPRTRGEQIAGELPEPAWALLAAALGWTTLFGLASRCFNAPGRWPWLLILAAAAGAAGAAAATALRCRDSAAAIVVSPTPAEAFDAPARSAKPTLALPPASKVRTLAPRGSWTFCELPDGTRGWIAAESLAPVIPPENQP